MVRNDEKIVGDMDHLLAVDVFLSDDFLCLAGGLIFLNDFGFIDSQTMHVSVFEVARLSLSVHEDQGLPQFAAGWKA